MNRSVALLVLLAAGLALALRCPRLDQRPMHNDEAVNAVKFGQLLGQGAYQYDPGEHHGPALCYATLAVGWLTGAPDYAHYTEARLRGVTILFGVGLILLLPLVVDGLGRSGTVWAAVFTAVSPAFVFYSRYYIHEMLLVFFTFLALAAGWRYWRTGKLRWALATGAGLGLMDATKETFVLALAAAVFALCLNLAWTRFLDASEAPMKTPRRKAWHLAAAFGVCLLVALVLFSSFFTNAAGPTDSLRTYERWFNRASGESPHIQPWDFYFHRLFFFHPDHSPAWTEGLILVLAVIGAVAGFKRVRLTGADAGFVRFLSLYTFLLAAIYSAIPYKTPWCLLSFWQGMILLAGVGASVLLRVAARPGAALGRWQRPAVASLLLVGAGHLAWQASLQAGPVYAADRRNPYVYAQTSPDLLRLVAKVEKVAAVSGLGHHLFIKVMAAGDDYWPLPWYLRSFEQVGWWNQVPTAPQAPVMIASPALGAELDRDKTHSMVGYFELRPEVFLELHVETNLWTALARQ